MNARDRQVRLLPVGGVPVITVTPLTLAEAYAWGVEC